MLDIYRGIGFFQRQDAQHEAEIFYDLDEEHCQREAEQLISSNDRCDSNLIIRCTNGND